MNCLKSFSLRINGGVNATAPLIETWGPSNSNWIFRSLAPGSGWEIQGFKNINIHKIEAVGRIESLFGTNNCLVEDWGLFIQVVGQNGIIGGSLSVPNNLGMTIQTVSPEFLLSKYNPSIEFASPIQSATLFAVNQINAQGIGAENASTIGISWFVTFNIYYNFEGE